MINSTDIVNSIQNITSSSDMITIISNKVFLPSIVFYWLLIFLITLIVGLIFVRKDLDKFWAIFIFTQLLGALILFLIFIFPIIPQIINNLFL